MAEESIRNKNQALGRRRVEKYVAFDSYPSKYEDIESFEHDMSKAENKCIFCRNSEREGRIMSSTNHFICRHCSDHLATVKKGRDSKRTFQKGEDSILTYFYRNGADMGWAYLIMIPRVNWHIDFGDDGNELLFDRKEFALVAGIKHLIQINNGDKGKES